MEKNLMEVGEFKDYLNNSIKLYNFEAVSKFKSILRAIRKGRVTKYGVIIPKRPFNNRGNSNKKGKGHSRSLNELKKKIYGELKKRGL